MPRTFTTAWKNQALAPHNAPYCVLEIEWGGENPNTYYLDREQDSFLNNDGHRFPDPASNTVSACLVDDWGQVTLTLKEEQAGAMDSVTIKLADVAGELTNLLTNSRDPHTGLIVQQQLRTVKIYRMWDDSSCTWAADAAVIYEGITKPHTFNEADNTITFEIDDPSRLLIGSLGCMTNADIFPTIPDDYENKNIPTCWGLAQRVPAILVSKPWETRTLGALNMGGTPVGTYLSLTDHPANLKAPIGETLTALLISGSDTQTVQGFFIESSSPATIPSQFKVTAAPTPSTITCSAGTGTSHTAGAKIAASSISPSSMQTTLQSLVSVGMTAHITQSGVSHAGTITFIGFDEPTGVYTIIVAEGSVMSALSSGQAISFTGLAGSSANFPAGSYLRPAQGKWVYAVNSLPSKSILKVEGYGSISDIAGGGRKDFILLADTLNQVVEDGSASVTTTTSNYWSANLNDSTWNLGTLAAQGFLSPNDLGRNITTVTFTRSPREVDGDLDDNRIWVTLLGVEDKGDGTGNIITNPVLIMLQYLENPALLNLVVNDNGPATSNPSQVNLAAFEDAATSNLIIPLVMGFAQVDSQDGLIWLQTLAFQCRSVLSFDQGQVTIVVLRNNPTQYEMTFSESNILETTLQRSETDSYDVVTRAYAEWTYHWDGINKPRKVLANNTLAELDVGVNSKEINSSLSPHGIWAYNDRSMVVVILVFWLVRWDRIYRIAEFETLSKALLMLPGDWVQISYQNRDGQYLIPASTMAEVLATTDLAPSGRVKVQCRYPSFTYTVPGNIPYLSNQ